MSSLAPVPFNKSIMTQLFQLHSEKAEIQRRLALPGAILLRGCERQKKRVTSNSVIEFVSLPSCISSNKVVIILDGNPPSMPLIAMRDVRLMTGVGGPHLLIAAEFLRFTGQLFV
jgi:hypothetical protein